MKTLFHHLIAIVVLINVFGCQSTDVTPEVETGVSQKHSNAKIMATASVYITGIEMLPATSPQNPFYNIRIKFLCPDVTNVHKYKVEVSTNNQSNWTTLTASSQQLVNIALPSAAPLLPSARAYQSNFTNVNSNLFANAPLLQFRIIAVDVSGTIIGTSWPASTRQAQQTTPSNSPSIISNPQLLHYHTKDATGKPQIVMDWGMQKSAYTSAGFPNSVFEVWSSANGVSTILYKSSSGWQPGATYKLLSNAANQTSIVVDAMANNAPLAVGSSHSFYVISRPSATYMYANTSPTFTTRVPSIFPGCQMRPNILGNTVVKYEKVEFVTGKYWVFLNWGEAQLGGFWTIDYRSLGSTVWTNWSSTGQNFLPPMVNYPGTYQVRVTPNGFGGFNAVNLSNMTL